MSTVVERLELLLTGNAKDAVAAIRQTQAAAVDLDSSTGQVQKRMGLLGGAAQAAGTHIRDNIGTYSVAAVGALAAAGAASINEFTDLAEKVRDFSRASGANADTSSRLVAIFDDLEISQQAADTGFFRLNRTIAENNGALDEYGVKVKTANDGSTDIYATLLSVADAYEDAEDSATRAALVQEAFGRGGKDLIPILERGRAGIEDLFAAVPGGQILDQAEIDRAREFELAMDDLADAIQEIKVAAGSALAPAVASIGSGLAGAIRTSNEATSSIGGLSTVLGYASTAFNPLYLGSNVASGAMALLKGNVGEAANEFAHAIPGVGSLADKFGLGSKKSNEFADSQKRLSGAQAEVARLAADSSTKHSELTAAKRELSQAENDYEGVVRRVSAALGENTSKIIENQNAGAMYTNAQLSLTGAQLNVEAATARYNQTLTENGADALETRQAAQNLEVQYEALRVATINAAVEGGASQEEAAAQSVAALEWVAGTLAPGSPLRDYLEQYIARLHGIPAEVGTTLRIRTLMQDIVGADVSGAYGPVPEFSGGGVMPGPPGKHALALVAGGETVFQPDQLAALARAGFTSGAASSGGGNAMRATRVTLEGGPPGLVDWIVEKINEKAYGGPVFIEGTVQSR